MEETGCIVVERLRLLVYSRGRRKNTCFECVKMTYVQ